MSTSAHLDGGVNARQVLLLTPARETSIQVCAGRHLEDVPAQWWRFDFSGEMLVSMEVNNKVAADLLRKYGVLVDPLSLSEQALARLARRINYPRVHPEATLRAWSDQCAR